MIDRLATLAELVARASWQAGLLAVIVAVVVWCFGERLAARWRYLLWSVVLVRLLLVIAPASPWSIYQLARWPAPAEQSQSMEGTGTPAETVAQSDLKPSLVPEWNEPAAAESREPVSPASLPVADLHKPVEEPTDNRPASAQATIATVWFPQLSLRQGLSVAWLVGAMVLFGQLIWAYAVLQKKLVRCQPVQEEAIQESLRAVRQKLGFKRHVELLVTAEPISPCVVGVWRPRLVVPELALTELDRASLEQVFCHELVHVARGDLWMNWLMLAARCVHWFNPVAWWMVREMQSLREMACDERTIAALDADQRQDYADTILSLVGLLAPSPLAPGMVALFSSRARLSRRIEHIALGTVGSRRMRLVACGLLVALALAGWTDAQWIVAKEPSGEQTTAGEPKEPLVPVKEKTVAEPKVAPAADYTLRGRTMKWVETKDKNRFDTLPLGNVDVTLYRVRGMLGQPEKIAETKSDADGRFAFENFERPRTPHHFDRLTYGYVAQAPGQPSSVISHYEYDQDPTEGDRVDAEGVAHNLSGRLVNEQGEPIAGAVIFRSGIHGTPVPGVYSTVTDGDGKFSLDYSLPPRFTNANDLSFSVKHADYPQFHVIKRAFGPDNTITAPARCTLEGSVLDDATGQPVAGALVTAENNEEVVDDALAETDDRGHYRLVVKEGSYNIFAETADRVTLEAATEREISAGQTIELPTLRLTAGGWIEGRVLNTKTGKPVVDRRDALNTDQLDRPAQPRTPFTRVSLGLFGPAYPARKRVNSAFTLAYVDEQGRFRMRAAAGDNYPYLVNAPGQRMMWDTRKQPPVVVKTGETTHYDMLITPKPTDAEQMKVANELVAGLPQEMPARVEAILAEFRKLSHTVDEPEIWCSLMRELVAIGPAAVPGIAAELAATDEQRTIRRLAFALRAIGDPRAVPALIRAIPKTLQPPMSDYGLLVGDQELTKFMREHDLDRKERGRYFDFGRPVREVFGALHKLTRQDFDDEPLYSVVKSENPKGEAVQRKMYRDQAEKWQTWWEAHWREFTEDEGYSRVGLPAEPAYTPPPFAIVGNKPKAEGGSSGEVLSPPGESGAHFLDLDTGLDPAWPKEIPRSELGAEREDLALWAAQNGVDLTCVTRKIGDQDVYALRGFNMRLEEISLRDAKNIDKFLERGALPTGRPVGELLLKLDDKSGRYTTGNAAFLYQTREGALGLIELTDQVTEARDVTGNPFRTPGVGFHKGVRFNHRTIVPAN